MLQWELLLNGTDYFRVGIKLQVWKCAEQEAILEDVQTESDAETAGIIPPMVTQWFDEQLTVGSMWVNSFQDFLISLAQTETETKAGDDEQSGTAETCFSEKEFYFQFDFYPLVFLYWSALIAGVVVALVLVLFILRWVWRSKFVQWLWVSIKTFLSFLLWRTKVSDISDEDEDIVSEPEDLDLGGDSLSSELSHKLSLNLNKSPSIVPIKSQPFVGKKLTGLVRIQKLTVEEFLQKTVEQFFSEIDKLLMRDISIAGSGSVNSLPSEVRSPTSLVSPRTPNRHSLRRSRTRLSSPALSTSVDRIDDYSERRGWLELEQMTTKLGWTTGINHVMEDRGPDPRLHLLLDFHRHHCPIRIDQWNAASLVVNYTLVLLEKELSQLSLVSGIRFLDFSATGSAKKGVKVSKANQFDVHFLLQSVQYTVCEAVDSSMCTDIPPGRVLLSCKGRRSWDNSSKPFAKQITVNHITHLCLSAKEVLAVAEEMIDRALQNLYSNTRSLMDRLPFRIQRAATTNLMLTLDTRHLLGLGVSDLKIRLIPALNLPVSGWFQAVPLYAVPPWVTLDYKRRSSVQGTVPQQHGSTVEVDLLWHLSFGEFEQIYLAGIIQKMRAAGVTSCHHACLQILKVLLTAGAKTALLDRGELCSHQIETVLSYLLLESSPQCWTYDKLPDRVSDCIYFLESAVRNRRLPNFYVSNPHLMKQMPYLHTLPMVSRGRQENLFIDLKTETVEKILNFLKLSTQEAGLQEVLKEEFSSDMWEYEFFIFG